MIVDGMGMHCVPFSVAGSNARSPSFSKESCVEHLGIASFRIRCYLSTCVPVDLVVLYSDIVFFVFCK